MSYITDQVDAFIFGTIEGGGKLNRHQLQSTFKFNGVTASRHIQRFVKAHPNVLHYSLSDKCYRGLRNG